MYGDIRTWLPVMPMTTRSLDMADGFCRRILEKVDYILHGLEMVSQYRQRVGMF